MTIFYSEMSKKNIFFSLNCSSERTTWLPWTDSFFFFELLVVFFFHKPKQKEHNHSKRRFLSLFAVLFFSRSLSPYFPFVLYSFWFVSKHRKQLRLGSPFDFFCSFFLLHPLQNVQWTFSETVLWNMSALECARTYAQNIFAYLMMTLQKFGFFPATISIFVRIFFSYAHLSYPLPFALSL